MVKINIEHADSALVLADKELERRERLKKPRLHLGMSGAGYCPRKQWYGWLWAHDKNIPARGLCAIDDGIRGEDVVAARLQQTPGLTLLTRDPETGRQFEVVDAGGHVAGHMDGVLMGHPSAPKTPHVWECKVVNERKFKEFKKIKNRDGQKATLRQWDFVYWVQAQLYMLYAGYKRHWITVATAGCRDWDAARTEIDVDEAEYFAERLRSMVENVNELPERVAETPSAFACKWCDAKEICHNEGGVNENCRTCSYGLPVEGPQWECTFHNNYLSLEDQLAGCGEYVMREALAS